MSNTPYLINLFLFKYFISLFNNSLLNTLLLYPIYTLSIFIKNKIKHKKVYNIGEENPLLLQLLNAQNGGELYV